MNPAPETDRNFEHFTHRGGHVDVMEKVAALDTFLRAHSPDYLDGLGLHVLGPAAEHVAVRDAHGHEREVIMLGSNSYLGLTTHPRVVAACQRAAAEYGYGMGAVPLYAGTTPLHRELEERIAAFYGKEDAILFPCGYSGNIGVISALCGPGDVVINDAANHASIFDGSVLSGANLKIYLHRNMRHLEKILNALPDSQRGRLIITDGVFSMHGDLAPLDELVALARQYGCRVMVDEAHGVGVVGPTGRGTPEQFNCAAEVDLICGTLSKTPGAVGGYCAGSAALVRYLRFYARTYFFSTALPAPTVAGLIEVFKLMAADAAGRETLWKNVDYLLNGLRALGFDTGETASPIIPIRVGDETKLGLFQNELRRRGLFTNVVTYPAVRRKECRLRLSVTNTLSRTDLDQALTLLSSVGRELGIIP